MNFCLTQRSAENRLCAIHFGGNISVRDDGVYFWSPKPELCRIERAMGFDGLMDKVWSRVQVPGDSRDVTSITHRRAARGDDGRISYSSVRIKNDEDVVSMFDAHDSLLRYKPLELYVETQRSVNEILRRLRPPSEY